MNTRRAVSHLSLTLFIGLFFSITVFKNVFAEDNFNVVVTVKPIHSLLSGLMNGVKQPTLIIDGQSTPFNFELSDKNKKDMHNASLLFWVGAELEKTLEHEINGLSENVTVIELLSHPLLKILPSRQNPNQRDPFFWMDDRNILILLDDLTQLLTQKDPAHSHIYSRNRREMIKPLLRLDKEYEYGYRGLKAGLGVMYFDTLRYFEQAYALKNLGYAAGTPWDSVQASNLLSVRSSIINSEASCLFTDKSMPADNLQLLTNNQDINLGELDVLGREFEAGEDLYIKLMDYNTDVIKQCLNANMKVAAQAREKAIDYDGSSMTSIGGGRFLLTNHLSEAITDLDMKGQYSLIFFGYTNCPDICPTSLSVVSRSLKFLDKILANNENTPKLVPYFISVDPERDSVAVLKEYVAFFDPRLVGLTGSVEMIHRLADQFHVKFEKVPGSISHPQLYAMNHTAGLFLMDPDGRFITKFAHEISAQVLAEELADIID